MKDTQYHDHMAWDPGHNHSHHDHELHSGHNHHAHEPHSGHTHSHDHHHGMETEGQDLAPAIYSESLTLRIKPGALRQLADAYGKTLASLAEWVNATGGVVGHIKLTLSLNQATIMLSTTGGAVQRSGPERFYEQSGSTCQASLAAIVYQVDQAELESKMQEVISQLKNAG